MKEQAFIPILATDSRVLGTCAIDRVTFAGNETSVTIAGQEVSIRKFSYFRAVSNEFIEYMGHEVTPEEERRQDHQHLPGFSEISENTPQFGWTVVEGMILQPDRYHSFWEEFLLSGNF